QTVLQVFNGAFELQVSDLLQVDETSAIDMIDGKANDQLVVPGDFASTGTLLLDAELNTVNGKADTLVIGGDVQKVGSTTVVINDVGDGSSDDILPDPINIVSVDGETWDGDFVLDGPVFSGLVEYDLLLDGNDWNLVASVLDQAFVLPNVQAIISGDTRQVIGSLRDRTTASFSGGRGPVANFGNPYTGSKWGTWIRLGGSKTKAGGSLGTGLIADDSSYSSTLGFVQGGIATRLLDNGFSKLIASVFGHYSDSDADISDAGGTEQGTVSTNSAGVGGSLTWLSTSGWYADLLGLASWHDIDTSTVNGAVGSTDGDTLAGSFELGYSLRVSDNVNVIPQAQVVYQRTRIDGFTDSFGVTSAFPDADGVDGRFGVAVEHVTAMYMVDGVFKANGEISVTHNFINDSNATINDQLVGFDSDGTELLVGGGLAVVPAADGFNFGFQGDYSIPLTDDGREGFSLEATAGVTF
ncbi:MAG: autotransporter outer membrane beta-barrel domain-containing protein, partial [Pseudomonadota bacterium]